MLRTGSDDAAIRKAVTPWLIATARDLWGHFASPLQQEILRLRDDIKIESLKDPKKSEAGLIRIAAIENFLRFERKPMQRADFSDYIRRLNLMQNPPEFTGEYLAALQAHMVKARDELSYLNENLEFRDRDYWFNLPKL